MMDLLLNRANNSSSSVGSKLLVYLKRNANLCLKACLSSLIWLLLQFSCSIYLYKAYNKLGKLIKKVQ